MLFSAQDRIASPQQLLAPEIMGRLARLDLRSTKLFAGKLQGERRSKRRGQSTEFDDFRRYTPGDDPRFIDWNAYARFGKLFLKLFLEEEDLALHVLIDASASMHAGNPAKVDTAARVSAMLSYIGLAGQNRVSLSVFGAPGAQKIASLPECRGRHHYPRIASFIFDEVCAPSERGSHSGGVSGAAADSATFNEATRRLAAHSATKGVVVIISDFLFEEGYMDGLRALAARPDYDSFALQILAREELEPELLSKDPKLGFSGDLRLTDIESLARSEVTLSADLIKAYKRRVQEYIEQLRRDCAARRIRHILMTSDQPIESLVTKDFRSRGMIK